MVTAAPIVVAVIARQPPGPDPEDLALQCARQFEKGEYGESRRLCLASLEADPENSIAAEYAVLARAELMYHKLLALAQEAVDIGDYDEALGTLEIIAPDSRAAKAAGKLRSEIDQARNARRAEKVAQDRRRKEAVRSLIPRGIQGMVFGDIYLQEHKDWVERVCGDLGIEAVEPLWDRPTEEVLTEFIDAGFEARFDYVSVSPPTSREFH